MKITLKKPHFHNGQAMKAGEHEVAEELGKLLVDKKIAAPAADRTSASSEKGGAPKPKVPSGPAQ